MKCRFFQFGEMEIIEFSRQHLSPINFFGNKIRSLSCCLSNSFIQCEPTQMPKSRQNKVRNPVSDI